MEIKNIQCKCCGEYVPHDTETCPYCGESLINESNGEVAQDGSIIVQEELNSQEEIAQEDQKFYEAKNSKQFNPVILYVLLFFVLIGLGFFVLNKLNPTITLFNSNENSSQNITSAIPKDEDSSTAKGMDGAKELFKHEKYDAAAEIFQSEIDKNSNPVAYYYLGEIYNKRGFTKLALRSYIRADEERANFYEAKKRLAEIYWQEDEDDKALQFAESAYKIKSNDMELLELLYRMYNYNNDTDKLISICKAIVKVDNSNYSANYYLANHYYSDDNYREAIPYMENLLKAEYNTRLAYNLALSYAHIEYYTKAMEVLDKIISNDPYEAEYASYLKANVKDMREQYRLEHTPKSPTPRHMPSDTKNEKGLEQTVEDALF